MPVNICNDCGKAYIFEIKYNNDNKVDKQCEICNFYVVKDKGMKEDYLMINKKCVCLDCADKIREKFIEIVKLKMK